MTRFARLVSACRIAALALAGVAMVGVVLLSSSATVAVASPPPADTAVDSTAAGPGAARVGLIGDSTLAGVRWAADYGALARFNFLLDAESCRRTLETSCWSREDYRPATTLAALEARSGEWGDVLVVMSGYNDGIATFEEAVDEVIAEAREQSIGEVIWLTLRTEVDYHDPQRRAGADTYRAANRVLADAAVRHDGYLHLADWATFSAERAEWFGPDGVHFSPAGVQAITSYIAEQVERVLAGDTITPARPAWVPVREGDVGTAVEDVQRALLAAGYGEVGAVDGTFGPRTVEAVVRLQRDRGLLITGSVGEETAAVLALRGDASSAGGGAADPATVPAVNGPADAGAGRAVDVPSPPSGTAADPGPDVDPSVSIRPVRTVVVGAAGVVALGGLLLARRLRRRSGSAGAAGEPAAGSADDADPPRSPQPGIYDHEREATLVG